jgi:hypothetical protein
MIIASQDKESAVQRLDFAIGLLGRLLGERFPFNDSTEALEIIRKEFQRQRRDIQSLPRSADPAIVFDNCLNALRLLDTYKGFIGFILRSSNIRNGFEIYEPIKLIGRALVSDAPKGSNKF